MTDLPKDSVKVPMATQRQVQKAVSGFLRGEFLSKLDAAGEKPKFKGSVFLKEAVKEAVSNVFSGGSHGLIREVVTDEINRMMGKTSWNQVELSKKIDAIIREEVRAILKDRLVINVTAKIDADINPTRYNEASQF